MPVSEWILLGLCVSAFFAGALNSIAGGGRLLIFPPLLGVLPAAVANATSTVIVFPAAIAGAIGYRKELWECRRFILRLLGPSLLGGFLGAWLVGKDEKMFESLVPWLILSAALLLVIQQPLAKWVKKRATEKLAEGELPQSPEPGWQTQSLVIGFQFLVALYGGYFGAGIGILMLSALGFMGVGDIHRMNALKSFLAAAISAAAVVRFVWDDYVNWQLAPWLVIAATVGGYAGARFARRLPANYVRYAIIAIAFGLSAYYFIRYSG